VSENKTVGRQLEEIPIGWQDRSRSFIARALDDHDQRIRWLEERSQQPPAAESAKVEKDGVSPKPCVACGKLLEPVFEHWKTYQPDAGCEIKIIGSFGSRKLDNNVDATIFRGVICDDCAVKFTEKMDQTC
jgi:hypothetical protein